MPDTLSPAAATTALPVVNRVELVDPDDPRALHLLTGTQADLSLGVDLETLCGLWIHAVDPHLVRRDAADAPATPTAAGVDHLCRTCHRVRHMLLRARRS